MQSVIRAPSEMSAELHAAHLSLLAGRPIARHSQFEERSLFRQFLLEELYAFELFRPTITLKGKS